MKINYKSDCRVHTSQNSPRQESIELHIAQVILDSFVSPADDDYIVSRFFAQKKMHRAFFWSASQAIEKYLKALLIINDEDVRDYNHSILKLHNRACEVESRLKEFNPKCHEAIKFDSSVPVEGFSAHDFVSNIGLYGSASNRYNSSGIKYTFMYLFTLDSYIFKVRELIDVNSIRVDSLDSSLTDDFYAYNPWFSSPGKNEVFEKLPNENFPIHCRQSETHLDYLRGHYKPEEANDVLKWLKGKMQL